MKIDEAEEIIDNMYQNKMYSRDEKTEQGTIIHLGIEVNFTKEEEASVILLREIQILRKKANKYDNLIDNIKDMIEEINADKLNYSESEWYLEDELKGYAIDKIKTLLKTMEGEKK